MGRSQSAPTTRLTIIPALSRSEGMALAAVEGQRLVVLLESLTPEQWAAPTECEPWSVRDVATHVLGNHEALASVREQVHQLVAARRRGGDLVDAFGVVQLADRETLSPADIVARLRAAFPASVRARRRWPGAFRAGRTTVPLVGHDERWSIAYLHDVIYTRDAWMHRMDICRAAGVEPTLDGVHDGAIVQRIVQEWADRHGQAFALELTGPAGGAFSGQGTGEVTTMTMDAVDFCRAVSGRDHPSGLLAVMVGY
ncbi:MAG: hypothetical protein JWN31_91 [Frankiales bacterium]|nr:hypothetical protein [Frankiales bacterium]